MFKKMAIISVAAVGLMAAQYATLKDGRTIIMHDNGTWEEVTVVRSGDAQVGVMAAKDLAGAPKAVSIELPLARTLVGKWKDDEGRLSYDFRNDGTVTYLIDGESGTQNYSIQFIDDKDNTIAVSIGDSSRYGKIVFGGMLRKFKISKDGKSAVDYSDEVAKLTTVNIKKVGEASISGGSKKEQNYPAEQIKKQSTEKGFVK